MTASNSGIVALSDGVRAFFAVTEVAAYFAGRGVSVPVVGTCGWKQREQILNQSTPGAGRVLFIPGTSSGDEGAFTQPRRTDGNPRALAKWERIVTASIWAVDASNLIDEQLQIVAADNLLEMTLQALQWFASADWIPRKASHDPKMSANLAFGREILFEFVHREPVFDLPQSVVRGATPTVYRNPAS